MSIKTLSKTTAEIESALNKANSAVQDSSYVHTDNNYSAAEKAKVTAVTSVYSSVIPATAEINHVYELGQISNNISFALPSGTQGNFIRVKFKCGSTPYTFTLTDSLHLPFTLLPSANTYYDICFEYDDGIDMWVGYAFACEVS